MRLRTVLSLANMVAIMVAFLVLFEFPAYSPITFYALVAWIFIGFALVYLPARSRAAAGGPAGDTYGGTFPNPGGMPLPSGTSGSPSAAVSPDFCVWCGTTLPAGAAVCPSCGHRVAPL